MNITVSITELLQAVGSENIRFQSMSTSMEHINVKKGVTIVSFATDAITPTDVVMGGGPSGIIIWVDQDLLRERLDELKQGKRVTYDKLLQQRDELLAALEKLTQSGLSFIAADEAEDTEDAATIESNFNDDLIFAQKAIAKAKGGAA